MFLLCPFPRGILFSLIAAGFIGRSISISSRRKAGVTNIIVLQWRYLEKNCIYILRLRPNESHLHIAITAAYAVILFHVLFRPH